MQEQSKNEKKQCSFTRIKSETKKKKAKKRVGEQRSTTQHGRKKERDVPIRQLIGGRFLNLLADESGRWGVGRTGARGNKRGKEKGTWDGEKQSDS